MSAKWANGVSLGLKYRERVILGGAQAVNQLQGVKGGVACWTDPKAESRDYNGMNAEDRWRLFCNSAVQEDSCSGLISASKA